jgi:diacylglycerol kinase (ATP)
VDFPSPGYHDTPDLLLVNPMAGGGRAAAAVPVIRQFSIARSWNVEICITTDPDDLIAKARMAAEAGRKRIFVLGGDGTFQLLVNTLAGYPHIVLGVIPAGGGNDFAASLGLPSDPIHAATLLLNDGEQCRLDLVRVRTADGKEFLYCGGGGVGLDSEAARYANGAYRRLRGRLRYVLAALRALLAFRPFQVRILVRAGEPHSIEASVLLVAVLNTPSYGAGLCLAPNAKMDDGKLELVVLDHLSLAEILRLLPAFIMRGQLKTPRLRRFSVAGVRIETDSPLWFQGDGELLGMTPVEISVALRAVGVLRPRPQGNT